MVYRRASPTAAYLTGNDARHHGIPIRVFPEGDPRKLKKMVLRDIAEKGQHGHLDRFTRSEQQVRPDPFRHLSAEIVFSEGLQTESGEEVSSKEVKQILLDCIGAEDKLHPLTDDALTKILNDKGTTSHVVR